MKTGYCTIMWNRQIVGKCSEPPPTTPKTGLHLKKLILCTWWNWKGVLYYELLLKNQAIRSNKYCSQLDQLKAALSEKYPELGNWKCIIFHQDGERPHFSLMTGIKLSHLDWETVISDSTTVFTKHWIFGFLLIWFLQNSLNGKHFTPYMRSLWEDKWC